MLSKGDSGVFIVKADSLFFKTFKMKNGRQGSTVMDISSFTYI